MDATTGSVAGASVQIGDPVTEKLLIDVLVGAEDLYTAITDCGAGGLSSAVGEMADGVGADVELDLVPLKYAGLEPWEIWLSEAQERMVVAVDPQRLGELRERCRVHGVELADLGSFTGDGRLVVRSHGDVVLDLDTGFLHDGRPPRRMTATMPAPDRTAGVGRTVDDPRSALLAPARPPQHRVQGAPRSTATTTRSSAALRSARSSACGPTRRPTASCSPVPATTTGWRSASASTRGTDSTTREAMAYAVVDEAIRNIVAVGADPDRVSLLDNFSWGDPRRASTLGDLVAAVDGCCAAAIAHGAPFVSGKDSLNNEYTGADGERHAVPPTLVITAVGHVPDADACVTPELAAAGNALFLLGGTRRRVRREPPRPRARCHRPRRARCRRPTRTLRRATATSTGRSAPVSCGRATTSARVGWRSPSPRCASAAGSARRVTALPHDDIATALFAESASRLVVEVAPVDVDRFRDVMAEPIHHLGHVTDDGHLSIVGVEPLHVDELVAAFDRIGMSA